MQLLEWRENALQCVPFIVILSNPETGIIHYFKTTTNEFEIGHLKRRLQKSTIIQQYGFFTTRFSR